MTYFTADQHFGHFNIIRLSRRPFAPVTFDELVANNRRFNAVHAKAAMADPFTLYCAER